MCVKLELECDIRIGIGGSGKHPHALAGSFYKKYLGFRLDTCIYTRVSVEDSYGPSHYAQREDGKRDSDLLDSRIE